MSENIKKHFNYDSLELSYLTKTKKYAIYKNIKQKKKKQFLN